MARDRRIDAAARRVERARSAVSRKAEDVFEPFVQYRDDPVKFCRDVLGVESATRRSDGSPYQFDVLTDLAAHPRVAIISGHGVGKTTTDACAALWWLLPRPYSKVIIVAPEFTRQVRGALFGEISKLARRAKVPLPIEVLAGRVSIQGYGPEWSILGMPATSPERIEGAHASGGLLLLCDEMKGIPQDSFDALQGALTGGADSRLLVTSTPGGVQGPFYRIISKGAADWKIHHLSSEDSSIVSPEWCEQRAKEWGRASPLYQARVQGIFSDSGDGVLFPLSLLESAMAQEVEPGGDVVLGVDVSRSIAGDENCIAVCRGGKLERLTLWRSPDTMVTVARVLSEAALTSPKRIRVDVGGPGGGVIDRLRQLGYRVEEVAFGGGALDPTRFLNKRAEMYFALRTAMEQGKIRLPDDDELRADLSCVTWTFDQRGRVKLHSKDDIRTKLGRSPDRADAVALALGNVVRSGVVGQFKVTRCPI